MTEAPDRQAMPVDAEVVQIAPVLRSDGGTDIWFLFDNGEVWVGQQGATDYRKAWPPLPAP